MFWWVTVPSPIWRVPDVGRLGQQLARVEVQVGLGVGADHAGLGQQQRHVGEQRGEHDA